MIYELHELQHAAVAPLKLWAETSHALFSNPFSPLSYAPGSGHIAAGSELLARVVKRYEKPKWMLDETTVGTREHVKVKPVVALEKPFCNLIHFEREGEPKATPVLLVAPMSGHHATLLRDTVKMLMQDFDVYVTDWIDARLVPIADGYFHFYDYVDYVQEFIRFLGPEVHTISVCQPTVPVMAAASLMAADNDKVQPRTLTLMGGPIDTRINPTAVNEYAKSHSLRWFDMKVITRVPLKYPGYMRRVYPGFLQHSGFVAMNPDRHLQAHLDFYNHLLEGDGESADAHRKFYDEYNAVLDLDAEFYLDTLKMVFMEHQLPRGKMRIHGQPVEPGAIHRPALLTIEGELDDISAPGQTMAAHDLCTGIAPSRKEHLLMPGVGHYGIFSGRRWRERIYPHVRDFIHMHS